MNGTAQLHVLLVEDNPADILLMRELLSEASHLDSTLLVAQRLNDALRLLTHGEMPDAVLLDLGLPDSQGVQTFRDFHAIAPDIPVLVLTALDDEEAGLEALKLGAQDYLVKGRFQVALLERSIRYAVERQRIASELRQSQEGLRRLAARLEAVREEERTRIAREIHDQLGQLLTGIRMDLRWMDRRVMAGLTEEQAEALHKRLGESDRLTQSTIETVQRLALEMRPGTLDNLGLASAIRDEARRFEERTGVHFSLSLPEDLPRMPTNINTAFFRIFQELLTNVARHAAAERVDVSLRRTNGDVALCVRDNGRGFEPTVLRNGNSLGLLGISERALLLNGRLKIESMPRRGTMVTVHIPLPA